MIATPTIILSIFLIIGGGFVHLTNALDMNRRVTTLANVMLILGVIGFGFSLYYGSLAEGWFRY